MTDTARTRLRSTLLILWLLPAASFAPSSIASDQNVAQEAQPAPNPITASERLQRAEWSLVRPTPIVTLHIRRVVGFAMLVPAGTLFLLYLFRPRPYVLAGAFAWAAGSMMLLVLSVDSGSGPIADPNTDHDRTTGDRRMVVRGADLRRRAAAGQRMVSRAIDDPALDVLGIRRRQRPG